MRNSFGQAVTVTLFGESHGAAVGAVLDGMAPGLAVDETFLAGRMALRRAAGQIGRRNDTVGNDGMLGAAEPLDAVDLNNARSGTVNPCAHAV